MATPEQEPTIKRTTPELTIKVGEAALVLTYSNVMLYDFHEPYRHVAHAFIEDPEKEDEILCVRDTDVVDLLREFHFPTLLLPYPTLNDEQAYIRDEMAHIPDAL